MPRLPIPDRPPFTLRARLLTPLGAGGYRYEADARLDVDAAGRLAAVAGWDTSLPAGSEKVIDEKRQKRAETRAKRAAEAKKAMEEAESEAQAQNQGEARSEEGKDKE